MPPTPGPLASGAAEGVLAPRLVSVRPEIEQGKALVKDESGDEEELLAGGGGGEEEELLAGAGGDLELLAGAQFTTCFTGSKVQILTQLLAAVRLPTHGLPYLRRRHQILD